MQNNTGQRNTDNQTENQKLQSFIRFLNVEVSEELYSELDTFICEEKLGQSKRELIFDRGQLMLVEAGKQLAHHTLSSSNDRVVHFNGEQIKEVNPYAYIDEHTLEMRGDDSKKPQKKRRTGSRSSSVSSNNNNNNNNNG